MSDDERSRSPSPLRLHPNTRGDSALFGHLKDLVDAVPGNSAQITSETTLVALHRPRCSPEEAKTLLENFTGVAETKSLCQINGDADSTAWYPRKLGDESDGASVVLRATFNKLMLAPTIRLECRFRQPTSPAIPKLPTLVLEFHMNINDQVDAIQDLRFENDGRITFTTTGSTSSGFNHLPAVEAHLLPDQRAFVQMLYRLRNPGSRRALVIRLHLDSLSTKARLMHNHIVYRLAGSFADRLSPTIAEYGAFRRGEDGVLCLKHRETRSIKDLIGGRSCHSMTALQCSDVFSTVAEAQVQLAYSAVVMDAESRETLLLWAKGQGGGFLYNCADFPVIALKPSQKSLPGSKGSTKLPNELECRFEFCYESRGRFRMERKTETFFGHLLASNPGVPQRDAYFRLAMSPTTCADIIAYWKGINADDWLTAKITPHINSFTFSSQLETCQQLGEPKNERWVPYLLNQRHDQTADVNYPAAARVDISLREKADAWLKSCKPWNAEQLQVIDSTISGSKAISVVMGPAGTGKTTLHVGLALYFWILGYHVLSLAPANSNCNHVASNINMEDLQKDFPGFDQFGFVNTDVVRLFPGHRDVQVKDMTNTQAKHKKVGHKETVFSLDELVFALEQEKSGCTTAQSRGIAHTVIKLAEEDFGGYPPPVTEATSTTVSSNTIEQDQIVTLGETLEEKCAREDAANRWDRLREYLTLRRTGKVCERVRLLDEEAVKAGKSVEDRTKSYSLAYTTCVAEVMGHNRFLITTTGNVRSSEMMNWWTLYGENVNIAVLIDESAKDLEINVWTGIVCEKWASKVRGVTLFGDDKQLKPTNTCVKSYDSEDDVHTQYNAYYDRLDISLPGRLIAEGFPFVRLKEQRRMNKNISDFPSRRVYCGELRDGPGMDKPLETVKPGLRETLSHIIASGGGTNRGEQEEFLAEASDAKARLHWIEVEGEPVPSANRSWKVQEHIDVFFSKIYPRLLTHFKRTNEKMVDNCMLICAYGYALQGYREKFAKWLLDHPESTTDDQPQLLTVDAAQGQEAMMVVFDTSLEKAHRLGFLSDSKRINVAVTRAKEVLWIVGGDMYLHSRGEKHLIKQYYDELKAAGKVHKFTVE